MIEMNQSAMDLPAKLLLNLAPWRTSPIWHVAFSGGLDSTVLLHLLAQLAHTHSLPRLTAIHVHHGLQSVADAWPPHCQAVCDALGVPLRVIHVQVEAGASLERAAREARYAAFAQSLGSNEVLFTAQHRDDQAETLLFRLLRGAGVRGLSAMPPQRALGQGQLLRPLLDVSRAELAAYAREHGLCWIDDPSNQDQQFSRNYLRQEIFPALLQRWPQALAAMARSAAHVQEAQGLLDELALMDLQAARAACAFDWLGLPSLEMAAFIGLSPARQRNALSHWLAPMTRLPDSGHWVGWESLRDAAPGRHPCWRLADGELQRAGGRLWWLAGAWLREPVGDLGWADPRQALALPDNGCLALTGTAPDGRLRVRYRQGGEVMAVVGRGHRDLKRLLNERGVPGFARGRLPLLYRGGELLAVGGVAGLDGAADGPWQLRWQPPA